MNKYLIALVLLLGFHQHNNAIHSQEIKISNTASFFLNSTSSLAYDAIKDDNNIIHIAITNFDSNTVRLYKFINDTMLYNVTIYSPYKFAYKRPGQLLRVDGNNIKVCWEVYKDKTMALLSCAVKEGKGETVEELYSYPAYKYNDVKFIPSWVEGEVFLSYTDVSDKHFVFNIGHDLYQGFPKHYMKIIKNNKIGGSTIIQERGKYKVQQQDGIKYCLLNSKLYAIWVDDKGCSNKGDNVLLSSFDGRHWGEPKKLYTKKYNRLYAPMSTPLKLINYNDNFIAIWESSLDLPSNTIIQYAKISEKGDILEPVDSLTRRTQFGDAFLDRNGNLHLFAFSNVKEYLVVNKDGSKENIVITNNSKSFGFKNPKIIASNDSLIYTFWLSHKKESEDKYISYFKVNIR